MMFFTGQIPASEVAIDGSYRQPEFSTAFTRFRDIQCDPSRR